jgi:hypothetical protein
MDGCLKCQHPMYGSITTRVYAYARVRETNACCATASHCYHVSDQLAIPLTGLLGY